MMIVEYSFMLTIIVLIHHIAVAIHTITITITITATLFFISQVALIVRTGVGMHQIDQQGYQDLQDLGAGLRMVGGATRPLEGQRVTLQRSREWGRRGY